MTDARMQRRNFLKNAGAAVLAAPVLSALSGCEAARQPAQAAATAPTLAPAPPKVKLSVRDFGAKGDGKTKDTLAIQQTIERCSVFGGGEVIVPAGDYLTGALTLRSNVTLH